MRSLGGLGCEGPFFFEFSSQKVFGLREKGTEAWSKEMSEEMKWGGTAVKRHTTCKVVINMPCNDERASVVVLAHTIS